jgi:2-methylisocitrate lyase-like PEP mutase family enzyme
VSTASPERRERFRELHAREQLFVMPNPWDVGSARLLQHSGFDALATTSAGFAWSLGKLDQRVTRNELVAHVAELTAAISVPLNVDSERCYPDDPGGIAATVELLADAGASGFSIEDYDPATQRIDALEVAVEHLAIAVEANTSLAEPMVLTARAENQIRRVDDLEDTIARLTAYRDAGADVVYAPGLTDLAQISRVVSEAGVPVNVLALPGAPTLGELAEVGVRRASTGSLLAGAAYGALVAAASELSSQGTSRYAENNVARETLEQAFG